MLFNLIGFNISWFGLVFLGKTFIPFALFWLGLHLYFCKKPLAEFKLILSITLIGTLVDSTLLFLDVLQFHDRMIIPFWLITLWATFAATIAHSLKFLANSKILQFTIGFIFPPLSYIGGASLSAVEFGYNLLVTYFILASIWGGLIVLFFSLKERFYFQEIQETQEAAND
tara:strand:- start:16133 stop:16645 length:513 start_codon:yes stop_codon:yes gene_type:complete